MPPWWKFIGLEAWFILLGVYIAYIAIARGWIKQELTRGGRRLEGIEGKIAALYVLAIAILCFAAAALVYRMWVQGRIR